MTSPFTHDRRPRVAIAGVAIESSAYSPHRATERDFHRVEGDDLLHRYAALRSDGALHDRAEWIGVFYARSIPGGRVVADVYEQFARRIVDGIGAAHTVAPLDGVYLDLHGAMSVDGMDDAEGDLVARIRATVGPDVLISASMDLHGNVSRALVSATDLLTCFRMAPHEDAWESRERAIRNLLRHLDSGVRPVSAWVRVPILLPGEKTSTRVEPARSLYGRLDAVETTRGVTDASIWIGYAWADEPRCHATVIVVGDDDIVVRREAEELAAAFWAVKDDFAFVGPTGTLEDGVRSGLASREKPYIVSDSGDNPGAGGTGDVTWALHRLIEMPEVVEQDERVVYCASVFDAPAIEKLSHVTIGDSVSVTVGARVDARVSPPVLLEGVLESFWDGDPHASRIAVLRIGGLRAIITEYRKAFHAASDFSAIGLDPLVADVIVTKIGYLEPELHAIATGWTLALTPGPVDQDLGRLGHTRIDRPMFPFDDMDGVAIPSAEVMR